MFLILLLLLSLPGVVLLISKHLKPGARRLADPPYVRRTEAYNNPLAASSASIRVLPPITAQWVEKTAMEKLGHLPARLEAAGGRFEPIMSEHRRFELLAMSREGGSSTLVLLGWLAELGCGEVRELEAEAPILGRLDSVEVEQLSVPQEVIKELKGLGYVVPPAQVGFAWLRFAHPPVGEDDRLRIVWRTDHGDGEDVMNLRGVFPAVADSDNDPEVVRRTQQGANQ